MAKVVVLRLPKENEVSTLRFFQSLDSSRLVRAETCVCRKYHIVSVNEKYTTLTMVSLICLSMFVSSSLKSTVEA